ncbi:hypothetical protein BRD22_11725 [Halobacteriales archaeon SW_8_68_21]|nr:MAG: hypothetical protein BRD22_11725 [Halobacteriales archaeon SW_8_68_21]
MESWVGPSFFELFPSLCHSLVVPKLIAGETHNIPLDLNPLHSIQLSDVVRGTEFLIGED